ncbi:MAG: hypothetical protein K2X38_00540 [Gemmataceae bacterium]|nr:hypothetical protein [Gemmataceae bacterium]
MRGALRHLAFAALLAVLGMGCRHTRPQPEEAPERLVLPIADRNSWKIEAIVPERPERPERPGDLVRLDYVYQSLSDRQAQCLASARSSKANLLDEEADAIGTAKRSLLLDLVTREHRNRPLKQEILRAFALEERNQSAGQALETFHRLVEAEAKSDVVRSALSDMETGVREIEKRRTLGLPISADLEAIESQQLKLQQDRVKLDQGIDQGNESLAMLIGAESATSRRFLPLVDWRPDLRIPEEKAAIAEALQTRPGHLLIERLEQETDRRTLSAVKLFLQTVSASSAGSATPPPTLLGVITRFSMIGGAGRAEEASRQNQMSRIRSESERLIASEVTQALGSMRTQKDAIELARRKLVREQNRLKDLEAKQAQGLAAPLQLLAVRQQVRQVEVELIEELAGWHLAKVRLRRAQGHLVRECGSERNCACCGSNHMDYRRLPTDLSSPQTQLQTQPQPQPTISLAPAAE